MTRKRGYRRGYSVAVLIGLEENGAILWRVFSNVVKPHVTLRFSGMRSEGKALYNFHEEIVNALRPLLKEGVKSIVVTCPMRTDYAQVFLDHVWKHDTWLVQTKGPNSVTFGVISGSASKLHEVADLVKTRVFRDSIIETTSADADRIMETLEKWLIDSQSGATVLYSLEEVEDIVYAQLKDGKVKPEHIMLTNEFLQNTKVRNRVNRLLQISKNKNVKTTIVYADTPAGTRLTQLGGLVCLARSVQTESRR